MRRLLFSLLAMIGSFSLVGCHHTAGICDCDLLDPCYLRTPWVLDNGVHPVFYQMGAGVEEIKTPPRPGEKKKL